MLYSKQAFICLYPSSQRIKTALSQHYIPEARRCFLLLGRFAKQKYPSESVPELTDLEVGTAVC